MIRSSRGGGSPRRMLIVAATALIPLLAGCGIGNSAQTQSWHQPTDGSTLNVPGSGIRISDAFVLGAAPDSTLATGQNAGLFLAIYNGGPADQLTSIQASGTATRVQLPGGSVSLRPQKLVLLTGPQPQIVLSDLVKPLAGGSTVELTLHFVNAGEVTMTVPVMPRAQYYQTFSPAPATSPSASPSTSRLAKSRGLRPILSPGRSASPSPVG